MGRADKSPGAEHDFEPISIGGPLDASVECNLSCSLLSNKFLSCDPGDPVLKLPPKLAQGISGVCYLGGRGFTN